MNHEFVKLNWFDGHKYTCWANKVKVFVCCDKLELVLDHELPHIPNDPVPKAGKEPYLKVVSNMEKLGAL